jgi:valyl-tRNA synthetase
MFDKTYNPVVVEDKWIERWQKAKIFSQKVDKSKRSFTIVIPPPNITGALHMGHALNNTLQDEIIRYKKMCGYNTYWVCGTDHGGIATQNVIEKTLKKEGIKRSDITREEFLNRMWKWYDECGGMILEQLKKIGCSIDFSKENIRFTMDAKRSYAVVYAFNELWKGGYIYRGERMINWCPRCYTALSDIEVEYEEEKSKLYYINYPLEDGAGFLAVATTRPETMLGDTAIAVNPNDRRYKDFVGRYVILPLVSRKIKVIADERIDMNFGTGVVKITPAHDNLDYEISKTHNLEVLKVINEDGRMINCPSKYLGLKVLKAREEVVKDLKDNGLLIKEEDYTHNVSKCYRCDNYIEPMLSEQWFVKYKPLSRASLEAILKDEVRFYPDKWKKTVVDWLNNIKDWCISRQIWWGHRIPAYYCRKCSSNGLVFDEKENFVRVSVKNGAKPIVSIEKPSICPDCKGTEILQDPDVLDTWFSSALWPFSVFDWPKKTEEFEYFYPTTTLVTGYEILYLWVVRMITSGLFHTGMLPFKDVYVHGIVRDKHGQKMSKSKGNVIDPLDIMKKYGTDAMRFSLTINGIGGKDIHFDENMIIGGRNFVNKIYNVGRFIYLNTEEKSYVIDESKLDISDKWIITRVNDVLDDYRKLMDEYLLSEALDLVYGFSWDEFCDWYIEITKFYSNSPLKDNKMAVVLYVYELILKMLHPFIPFITEEVYALIKERFLEKSDFIVNLRFKKFLSINDEYSKKVFKDLMEIIKEIRTIRSEFAIHPAKEIDVSFVGDFKYKDYLHYIKHLAKVKNIYFEKNDTKSIRGVAKDIEIYVIVDEEINFDKEKERIEKEIKKLNEANIKLKEMLDNKDFLTKAPKEEVEKIRQKIFENDTKLSKLKSYFTV